MKEREVPQWVADWAAPLVVLVMTISLTWFMCHMSSYTFQDFVNAVEEQSK